MRAVEWLRAGRKRRSARPLVCEVCGRQHADFSFAYRRPVHVFDVPEAERERRVKASDDLCRILPAEDDPDGFTFYFVRATLDVPINGTEDVFTWGVWVSHSKDSFDRYVATFNEDQSDDGAFGWLTVSMPGYARTQKGEPFESLACDVEWNVKGQRPEVIVREADHPLFYDQHDGISHERAVELVALATAS